VEVFPRQSCENDQNQGAGAGDGGNSTFALTSAPHFPKIPTCSPPVLTPKPPHALKAQKAISYPFNGIILVVMMTMSNGHAESDFFTPEEDLRGMTPAAETDAGLPDVLILGDSISIGYTPMARERLQGVANVSRPNVNCGDTRQGLRWLENWLGTTRWDVIHFNWGLHDLCYRHPESKVYGNRDKVWGTVSVDPEQYARNLEELVRRLRATGATLVWASTTLVPEGEAGRFVGDDVKYNAIAADIMERHGILVNDLHAFSSSFPEALFTRPGDVHFTRAGSEKLAGQVAESILSAIRFVKIQNDRLSLSLDQRNQEEQRHGAHHGRNQGT